MLVPFRNPIPAHDSDVPSVHRQLAVVVPTTSAIVVDSSFSRSNSLAACRSQFFCMYMYSSVNNFL
ncbi:hypothetical protein RHMOL_Rhmol04G0109200 [Rhododendron molle]|nr:hypothetical protein RHMOL_Rhmol04G0109200 [Rhododendron molle]